MYRLLVDFNDITDDVVTGLHRSLTGPHPHIVQPGDRIRLHDDGEHEVWGDVTRVQGELISAKMDRSTWGPAGHITIVQMVPGGRAGLWIRVQDPLETSWTEGDQRATRAANVVELPLALPPAA